MEEMNPENWNEARYKELNTYFRIKIEHMLRTDTHMQEQLEQNPKLELADLVAHFSEEDQERWKEFIALDQQKMKVDMWNHLNGTGTRYEPGIGFTSTEDDTTW
ncbi:hypothetical protein [Pontibacter liquoris]|uniref:hypothetical protein n=1 Tax=Pontibacter liquoris TaxID=2905677 RepID=UPI001FA76DC5|nr:hypothetical protein [Pontibacter liquoris]